MIWRPLQNPHLRRISALCAARSLAYLSDMSALAALLRLELHPHLGVLQRSHMAKTLFSDGLISRISLTFATAFIHSRNCAPVNYPARMDGSARMPAKPANGYYGGGGKSHCCKEMTKIRKCLSENIGLYIFRQAFHIASNLLKR